MANEVEGWASNIENKKAGAKSCPGLFVFKKKRFRACWGFGFRGKNRQFFDETRRKNGSIAIPK